jgi:hypothetical protein
MALLVVSQSGYCCDDPSTWRSEDFDANKWIKALKGRTVNGYAHVPVRGANVRLNSGNASKAADWFGMKAADYISKKTFKGPFNVVPVPNSGNIVTSNSKPRTRRLAAALCDHLGDGSTVVDCLRWKKALGSASKEHGPRDAAILYKNLAFLDDENSVVDSDLWVILVDDVMTSGGHIRACAAKLASKDLTVGITLCGGKTVHQPDKPAFYTFEDKLEIYEP